MTRYLVTVSDDPTLAAQAHAAIVAVPGVVGVEEIGTHAGIGLVTGGVLDLVESLRRGGATSDGPVRLDRADSARVEVPFSGAPSPDGRLVVLCDGLTYTVGDEEDGEHE